MRSASSSASSRLDSGRMTANSSPPTRQAMSVARTTPPDPVGDLGQHGVAAEVADAVVDPLEVVEVEDDQRHEALVALRARAISRLEELVEEPAVVQAGERVELGLLARLAVAARVGDRGPGPPGQRVERLGRRGGKRRLARSA